MQKSTDQMTIKVALFDLDGTLVDTSLLIRHCFLAALATVGIKEQDIADPGLLTGMGLSLEKCFARMAPGHDANALAAAYRDAYPSQLTKLTQIFDKAAETVAALHAGGVRIGIVTTRKLYIEDSLALANIDHLVEKIVGGGDVLEHKPSPEGIRLALAHFGTEPSRAAMIGDSSVDILAGKNAGTMTIGVGWSHTRKEMLSAKPDHLIAHFSELPALILG